MDRTSSVCVVRALVFAWLGTACGPRDQAPSVPPPPASKVVKTVEETPVSAPVTEARVRAFCGDCHAYPPPDTFPRANWPFEVRRGFDFFRQSDKKLDAPPVEAVVAYYESKAPEAFPVLPVTESERGPVAFRRREVNGPRSPRPSAISNVGLLALSDPKRLDILACDMARGDLLQRRAGQTEGPMSLLAEGLVNPGHVEVADLDGDGVRDLLVADLGAPMPTDDRNGRVLWLKGDADGKFETIVLASGLGRVCDIQAADFDGDGDLDLVVAVFGWRLVGEVLYMENQGVRDGKPTFRRETLDARHGTIHVPVADINGDGRPDFVALITQEHETIVAFLNAGGGRFTPQTLYKAPHPAYGSSGIQLVDLDGDGDLDILLSNGDVYDSPLLKPYHGVAWLENRGEGLLERHAIGPLYGAHRALAGDLDGDGDLDIVATSFLGEPYYDAMRRGVRADAVVLFEQVAPGEFTRHVLERETCDYPSFALADIDGDGDLDIVAGRFRDFSFAGATFVDDPAKGTAPIVIWENLGR